MPFNVAADDMDLIWGFRMDIKIISFHKGLQGEDSFLGVGGGGGEKHLSVTYIPLVVLNEQEIQMVGRVTKNSR